MNVSLRSALAAASVAALLVSTGCKKKETAPDAAPAVGQPQAVGQPPAAPANVVTIDEYEKLLVGLAACNVVGRSIDPKCPARTAYNGIRSFTSGKKLPPGAQLTELARKHAAHASSAVRLATAGLLRSFFGADGTVQDFVLDRTTKETDPAVMARLIEVVGSRSGQNAKVRELLMKKADDANEIVRSAALSWLASSWAKTTEGALDKVLEKIEKDPVQSVRALACRDAYKHENDRVLPTLARFVGDANIGAACLEGIVGLWAHFIVKQKSEKAYRKSLELLRKKPRDAKSPPWQVMSSLGRPVVAPWYKAEEVQEVLKDIVADKAAMWMARTGAVRALKDLKAPPAVFEALKKGYDGATGEHRLVLSQLEQAIKAPPPPAPKK